MGLTCPNHLMVITDCFFVTVFHKDIGKSRERKNGDSLKHRGISWIFWVSSVSIGTTIFDGNEIQQCIARASWIFFINDVYFVVIYSVKPNWFSIFFAMFFCVPFDSKSLKQFSWKISIIQHENKTTGSIQAFVVLTTALGNLFLADLFNWYFLQIFY